MLQLSLYIGVLALLKEYVMVFQVGVKHEFNCSTCVALSKYFLGPHILILIKMILILIKISEIRKLKHHWVRWRIIWLLLH